MPFEDLYRHSLPPLPPHCEPVNGFLHDYSALWQTCVPTNLAFLSSALGTLSIVSWLFAQLPQIWRNHSLQSTSGLSIYFLVEWCLGDLFNLLGAIFSQQAPWQIIIAGYYCFVDAVLVGQYVWYERLQRGKRVRSVPAFDKLWPGLRKQPSRMPLLVASLATAARAAPIHAITAPTTSIYNAGTVLSWMSTTLYLVSRFPQLYKNYKRKSTAGLSPQLFAAAFCGNLFYSSSMLANPLAWNDFPPYGEHGWVTGAGSVRQEWVLRALPFWLGAAGVLILDGAVGIQFLLYGTTDVVVIVKDTDSDTSSIDHDVAPDDLDWTRVSGWMRGWQPTFRELKLRVRSPEREGLLASLGRRYSGLATPAFLGRKPAQATPPGSSYGAIGS